ncbi:P-loop containing nucleoside triphosphate hydrolase protein, partial [Mycena maculata]
MLPSEPKIFHGRDSEVSDILKAFAQETPRIAILGAGGMGKTSLARAVLHHPTITARYLQNRVFVACDSVSTTVALAALIGSHVGLKPGRDLTRSVVQHFSSGPASLLVLDNLESIWESVQNRRAIEEFLSNLTEVSHLALIITMRGAEQPAKVHWTRPFLLPLQPLSYNAAYQTFTDITEDNHDTNNIDKILHLTGNMPLAIDLIAHLVDYEGCSAVLTRWDSEKTALLSEGSDRRSNLEISISLSLSSPRILALPNAKDLLGLLSILPDGLSEVVLLQSKIPIQNILSCRAVLLRTSLAYIDDQKHLKALVPIREYMQTLHHPPDRLIQPLLKHF